MRTLFTIDQKNYDPDLPRVSGLPYFHASMAEREARVLELLREMN